jgi:hypothetical protein
LVGPWILKTIGKHVSFGCELFSAGVGTSGKFQRGIPLVLHRLSSSKKWKRWNLQDAPAGGTPGKFQRGIPIVLHRLLCTKEY